MRYHILALLLFLMLAAPLQARTAVGPGPDSPPPIIQTGPTQPQQPSVSSAVLDIRDIKGPVPLSTARQWLLPLVALLAIIGIAGLAIFFLAKKRRTSVPSVSPDVVALAGLDQARTLMASGHPLAYAEQISGILRRYIEARFLIPSTRQTTQELFSRLKDGTTIAEIDIKNCAGNLQTCLEQCDIAKFAHSPPGQDEMMLMDTAARTFIEITRRHQATAEGTRG